MKNLLLLILFAGFFVNLTTAACQAQGNQGNPGYMHVTNRTGRGANHSGPAFGRVGRMISALPLTATPALGHKSFDMSPIPSGSFRYGFNTDPQESLNGVKISSNFGGLPQTSTASVDFDICDVPTRSNGGIPADSIDPIGANTYCGDPSGLLGGACVNTGDCYVGVTGPDCYGGSCSGFDTSGCGGYSSGCGGYDMSGCGGYSSGCGGYDMSGCGGYSSGCGGYDMSGCGSYSSGCGGYSGCSY